MITHKSKAPMRADGIRRFSFYKDRKPRSFLEYFIDWLVKGLFISFIISINFVLFASSANYSLVAEGFGVVPNILIPITCIFGVSLGLMFLISFSEFLENLLVSLVVGIFVFATINQFMILSSESFLYSLLYDTVSPDFAMNFINNSDVLVAVCAFVLTFILLLMFSKKIAILATFCVAVIFCAIVADEYINQRQKNEFLTVYSKSTPISEEDEGNKFVYIMLPNATSYRHLIDLEEEGIATEEVQKTKDTILGFLANNNFMLFANAYIENDDPYMNIVDQFNILSNKKNEENILNMVEFEGIMKFKNRNDKHVFLEGNELFDKFKNANYKINVYQSRGIEFCRSNNKVVVDKCVEKQNRPFNFDSMKLSEASKTKLLLLQWVHSTKLFKDLSFLYHICGLIVNPDKIGMVGISYDNLEVINSIKTFDVILNDMLKEQNNTTYFALVDMPGEMYVYDENCNIKPSHDWLSKENLPWVKTPNLSSRRKAYMEQTRCLYGKLQNFMDKLKSSDIDDKTVVIIQGISGFDKNVDTKNFISDFYTNQAVTMAIREPKKKDFHIDYNICPVSSFLIKYLYGKNPCKSMDLSQSYKDEMVRDSYKSIIKDKDINDAKVNFSTWYSKWSITPKNGHINLNPKQEEEIETPVQEELKNTIELPTVQEDEIEDVLLFEDENGFIEDEFMSDDMILTEAE